MMETSERQISLSDRDTLYRRLIKQGRSQLADLDRKNPEWAADGRRREAINFYALLTATIIRELDHYIIIRSEDSPIVEIQEEVEVQSVE